MFTTSVIHGEACVRQHASMREATIRVANLNLVTVAMSRTGRHVYSSGQLAACAPLQ